MIQNDNVTVLPFYSDIKFQNHRKTYAFGNIYPLFTPQYTVLPFQIIRQHRNAANMGVNQYNTLTMDIANYGIDQAGVIGTYNNWVAQKIPVQANKQYSFKHSNGNYNPSGVGLMAFMDSSSNVISTVDMSTLINAGGLGGKTFTTPTNCAYVFKNVVVLANDYRSTFQLEYGANTTAYRQYIDLWLSVKLCDKLGNILIDISEQMKDTGIEVVQFADYDVLLYPGVLPMNIPMPEGIYYLVADDGFDIWYSELFTVVSNMDSFLKIEWWDETNIDFDDGSIIYENKGIRYKNFVYLNTEIGKPEYPFEEDGEKRDGYFFPEKQISEKTFKFTFLATEYLLDSMRLIRLHDNVNVIYQGRTYDCDTFLITPKWQTQGDIASVETEFECATVVKKIGKGFITQTGDFSSDYNEDFKTN